MLPSRYRLSKKDFIQTLRRGVRSQIDGVQFVSTPIATSYARLGILVTKKFSKKAVERNLIKRRIAMAFFPYLQKEKVTGNIVCKIMQPLKDSSFNNIKTVIERYITSLS
jgi:ribonuclease P protein component